MADSKSARALSDFRNVQAQKEALPRTSSEGARESMREEMKAGWPHGVNPSLERPYSQFPLSGQTGIAHPFPEPNFPPGKFSGEEDK